MDLPKHADIVIIGGGVMGASTAYHLCQAGETDVVVLERTHHFEDGATNRCAGGVRYQFGTEVNVRLSMESLPMLERFPEEIGADPLYRKCGYLFVLTEQDDIDAFERNVEMQRNLGVETEWLSGENVRHRLPMMRFEDALAGTIHRKDGLADPNSVLMGYHQRAAQLGARLALGTEVVGIDRDGDEVVAVVTTGGRIESRNILIAAGPWLGQVGNFADIKIPVEAVKRQMVTTTPIPEIPQDFPFVIDFAQSLYFHVEGEGLLTGMSRPDQNPGFDQSVDDDWEMTALGAAMERMPLLENVGRLSAWAGLYEVTPDAHPIFGPTSVRGLWVVGGFSGHGFMHGPVAGKIMTEYILHGEPRTVDVRSLDLARFEEGRMIQEYNVI